MTKASDTNPDLRCAQQADQERLEYSAGDDLTSTSTPTTTLAGIVRRHHPALSAHMSFLSQADALVARLRELEVYYYDLAEADAPSSGIHAGLGGGLDCAADALSLLLAGEPWRSALEGMGNDD